MVRTSDAYSFTIEMKDGKPSGESAENRLIELRRLVSEENKIARRNLKVMASVFIYRIGLKGRLGLKNPAAHKYVGRMTIGMVDAVRADVYVYGYKVWYKYD